jgi:hypothetical protein
MFRMFFLGPATNAGVLFVLPLATLQLPDRLADAFLVLGVGKMGAQRATAVVRSVGVNTLAALTIDASPAGGEPGKVTAKHLTVVAWIPELDECTRESDQHFGHARQCMPAPAAVSVGNRAPAVLRRSEQTRFSSASDDEVGGISRAMRERPYEGGRERRRIPRAMRDRPDKNEV